MRKSTSGQLFSIDLVISLIIFLSVLFFFVASWNIYSYRLEKDNEAMEMLLVGNQILDTLLNSRGFPENWEDNTISVSFPGVMGFPGEVHPRKIEAFFSLPYDTIKTLLNIEKYEFLLKLEDLEGNIDYQIGISANQTTNTIVALERFIWHSNETKKLDFTIWQNEQ